MDKLQALMDAVEEMHRLFPMSAMRLLEAASDLRSALESGEIVVLPVPWDQWSGPCRHKTTAGQCIARCDAVGGTPVRCCVENCTEVLHA